MRLLSSEEKRSKKDLPRSSPLQTGKVLWFFFSKKNFFSGGLASYPPQAFATSAGVVASFPRTAEGVPKNRGAGPGAVTPFT
jgi:hypothetical protein